MSEQRVHVPVLLQPTLQYLIPRPGGKYIDGTLGGGGHTTALLEASAPDGSVLGMDADPQALAIAGQNLAGFGNRVLLRHANFGRLAQVAAENGFVPCDGVILDLGLSAMQLLDPERGFSFQSHAPLDMRFDPDQAETAADLVNNLPERELADLIFEYGEEHASRRIARAIVNARPITTADQLADLILQTLGRHGRTHPATRTFQALRIAVNRELEVLQEVLPQAADVLAPHGRVVIITFHSLEDRIVKRFLRQSDKLQVLTKHTVKPTREEILANPKSRSAKLRAAERVA